VLVTTAPSESIDLSRRDLTLDLARVVCVLLVVVIHLLFVGVGPTADGGIAVSRPLEEQPWFWLATWFGQIMPLFFVVGGFATATSLRSHRRRIRDRATADRIFVHGRMLRLARPALPLFLFLAVVLVGATVAGVDPALLDAVATGIGSPLWFLCAYLICQLFAPLLLDRHERAPRATLLVLFAAVVVVDVVQFTIPGVPRDPAGMSLLGYLNLLFVWPLVQQLGYWYADGWFARRAWWQLLLIAAVCWAALVPLTAWGPYSLDMLTNLNPPTVPLVVLGLGQAALLQLLKTPLTALMRTRVARGIVYAVGSRLMTVYLWHLPLIIAVAGLTLVVPVLATVPGSAVWWATRPIAYLAVLALVFVLSLGLGRFERAEPVTRPAVDGTLIAAAVVTIGTTAVITIYGLELMNAVAAAVAFGIAVVLLRPGQRALSRPDAAASDAEPEPEASAAASG